MAKERLTKKSICQVYADKIYATNLSLKEIENTLLHLWALAYKEGYFRRLSEQERFRKSRKDTLHKEFGEIRDSMEDTIHGGVTKKQTNG